jgi:hypothetical protein
MDRGVAVPHRLAYVATPWTQGEHGATMADVNEAEPSTHGGHKVADVRIQVAKYGSDVKARPAAYGMTWGYDAQFDALHRLLTSRGET